MEKETGKKLFSLIGKKQLLLLLLLGTVGLVLLLYPFDKQSTEENGTKFSVTSYTEKLEKRVEDLCLAVDGISRAEVLLTLELILHNNHLYQSNYTSGFQLSSIWYCYVFYEQS